MKNKIDVEKIKAKNNIVIVKLVKIPNYNEDGIYKSQNKEEDFKSPPNYLGKVIDFGEDVKELKKGEYVLFPKISYDSNHILTKGKDLHKSIHQITIVAKSKVSGLKVETLKTINNRIIVDIKEDKIEDKNDAGLITTNVENDPRMRDLLKGTIVSIGKNAIDRGYNIGDVVYISRDIGVNINEIKGKGKYRSIQWTDISFCLEE